MLSSANTPGQSISTSINIYLEFIDFLFPLLGQGCPEKEALTADHYEKKSLKNLSQVCSEAVNSEGTSEVAVQVFQGNSGFKGGSQYEQCTDNILLKNWQY